MKIDTIATAMTCKHMIRETIDLNLITLLGLRHEIPDPSYSVDFHLGAAFGELLAKAMDIDLDGIRSDLAGKTEDMIFGEFFRNNLAFAPHEQFENPQFARRQGLRLVIDERLPAFDVEQQVGNAQGTAEQLARAAEHGLQPCDQLLEREWLDQIVVRSAAKPCDPIAHPGPRGEHDDRNRVLPMANFAQDRQA